MSGTHDDDPKQDTASNSGAWTTGSGDRPTGADQPPAKANTGAATPVEGTDENADAETSRLGTDQESNVSGRSKPASAPAENAPPNTIPGVPDQ